MELDAPPTPEKSEKELSPAMKWAVLGSYAVLIIFWIVLLHVLGIAPWTRRAKDHGLNSPLGWFMTVVPVLFLGLGAWSAWEEIERDKIPRLANGNASANSLYLGILIAIPLFGLFEKSYGGDKKQFTAILVVSMFIAVFSQLDLWGDETYAILVEHIDTSLKTISIGLFMFLMLLYMVNATL